MSRRTISPRATVPSDLERTKNTAERLSGFVSGMVSESGLSRVEISSGAGATAVFEMPHEALRLLARAMGEMAKGRTVEVVATEGSLTTQQAATLLNVSRPYVVKLIEEGRVPSTLLGRHRRLRLRDVLELRVRMQARSRKALRELAEQAQELRLGYE